MGMLDGLLQDEELRRRLVGAMQSISPQATPNPAAPSPLGRAGLPNLATSQPPPEPIAPELSQPSPMPPQESQAPERSLGYRPPPDMPAQRKYPAQEAFSAHMAKGEPKLGGWKRGLDVAGQILVPGIEEQIPGTPGNYRLGRARLGREAENESKLLGSQADDRLRQVQSEVEIPSQSEHRAADIAETPSRNALREAETENLRRGKPEEPYTLGPGQKRFRGNQEIASGGEREVDEPSVVREWRIQVAEDQAAGIKPPSLREYMTADANRKAIRIPNTRSPEDLQQTAAYYNTLLENGSIEWPQVPVKNGIRDAVVKLRSGSDMPLLNKKQRELWQNTNRAMDVIKSIDEASMKIHSGSTVPGQKWASGMAETAASIVAPEGNPDLDALQVSGAALGSVLRTLGEMGALSEGDVQRGLAAIPVSRFLTRKEAEARLNQLRQFIGAAKNSIESVAGKTSSELFGGGNTGQAPPASGAATHRFNPATGKIEAK